MHREDLANTLIDDPSARNGTPTLTVCGSYLVVSGQLGRPRPRFLRHQLGGPARHQLRPPPASRAADIVPDIQRLASGSRLLLSCLLVFFSNSSERKFMAASA